MGRRCLFFFKLQLVALEDAEQRRRTRSSPRKRALFWPVFVGRVRRAAQGTGFSRRLPRRAFLCLLSLARPIVSGKDPKRGEQVFEVLRQRDESGVSSISTASCRCSI